MYKKILVPVDGSEKSLQAARHGARLAAEFDASVTLLYVVPEMPADIRSIVIKEINNQGKNLLRKAAQVVASYDVFVEQKILQGHPAETICKKARLHKYDLIVIGSRGLSGVKGYLLGSVSMAVTVHATCPVMIIR